MIHQTVITGKNTEIGENVEIGPYTVIGDNVRIGKNTKIGPQVVIEGPTTIGENCHIFQFCSLGAIPQDLKFQEEDTELIIGNDNTFREYVTINRGTEGGARKTVLKNNIFLMAYSHVAHDCQIGDNVIMANGATLGGHIIIEDNAILGGLVGVHQFAHIGSYAMVGGLTGVSKDVPPYTIVVGERAKLHGLNLTGLKRHNFSAEAIREIKSAYKTLFRSGLTTQKAIEKIAEEGLNSPEVAHLIDFIQNSERGITRE
jgi:UDP-N-acetylglucosamine acyltransferase